MKNNLIHHTWALLIAFCFSTPLFGQKWIPQGEGIFPPLYTITNVKVIDEKTVWGSVDAFPWSSAPIASAWITRTTDGGENWEYLQIPGAEGYVCWGLSAISKDTAWVSMNYRWDPKKSRIYRTTDGGKNWKLQIENAVAGFAIHFFDANNGIINRVGYRYTSDGGETWSPIDSFRNTRNGGVFLIPSESYATFGDTMWIPTIDGKVARSSDKGKNWEVYNTPVTGRNTSFNMIDFANGRNGLAAALFSTTDNGSGYFAFVASRLFRTEDGGVTWVEVPEAQLPPKHPSEQFFFINAIAAIPGAGNTFMLTDIYNEFVGENRQQVFRDRTFLSQDGGASWKLIDDNRGIGIEAIHFSSPTAGWAGSTATLPNLIINSYFAKWNGGTLTDTKDNNLPVLNVNLFPNPATNEIHLKLPETPLKNITIDLLDMYGKVLQTNTDFNQPFNIQNLPGGMYMAVVRAGEQVLAVRKWVKVE